MLADNQTRTSADSGAAMWGMENFSTRERAKDHNPINISFDNQSVAIFRSVRRVHLSFRLSDDQIARRMAAIVPNEVPDLHPYLLTEPRCSDLWRSMILILTSLRSVDAGLSGRFSIDMSSMCWQGLPSEACSSLFLVRYFCLLESRWLQSTTHRACRLSRWVSSTKKLPLRVWLTGVFTLMAMRMAARSSSKLVSSKLRRSRRPGRQL